MDLLWEFFMQRQVSDVGLTADQADQRATDVQYRVRQLEMTVNKLMLVNMAMWKLLESKTGLTEADLVNQVQILDLQDGVADGQITRKPVQCPKCGRVMSPTHHQCMYCGYHEPNGDAFAAVR